MSNYIYYVAYYDNKMIGKYKLNLAYNNLLELAELVGKKIYKLYKPKKYEFDLVDVQQKVTYRYLIDLQYFTFLEYGDYRIGHDKDKKGCDTYHPDVILPTLVDTIYTDMVVSHPDLIEGGDTSKLFWEGDKIPGLYRNDVFNYIHGKWYGN